MTALTDSERRMPDPWFRASNFNSPICQIFERSHYGRELRSGERRLGSFVLPPFQRPAVWTREQQIKLLESIWSGLPIGAYIYNRTYCTNDTCNDWLLDGQQRLTAILAYVAGEFPVFGLRYTELALADKRHFDFGTPIPALETKIEDVAACREVYQRLAYGGTSHV